MKTLLTGYERRSKPKLTRKQKVVLLVVAAFVATLGAWYVLTKFIDALVGQ